MPLWFYSDTGAVTVTLLDHQFTGNVSGASHTFTMNCGAGGNVVLCAQIFTTGNFGTVTIGGVTATQQVVADAGANATNAGIFTASGVPSGSQSVVINVSGGSGVSTRWGAQLYSISGQSSLTPASTATDTAHQTGSPAATLNVPAGGAIIGSGEEATGTATSAAWIGITTDVSDDSGVSTVYTSGSTSASGANASLSTSVTFSGGTTAAAVAAWAVWSP